MIFSKLPQGAGADEIALLGTGAYGAGLRREFTVTDCRGKT